MDPHLGQRCLRPGRVAPAGEAGTGLIGKAARKGWAGHTGSSAFPTHPSCQLQQMIFPGRGRIRIGAARFPGNDGRKMAAA
ncbi:hypothetical protein NDU88_004690 [Pleurodeles waltl]|uniref:Uncharacterized protein n=1 Tax=Pleurodeles waltl TaxID=8319 RepID=A0AAV7L5E4_PLEWA|nr:hypothetical protein NDU88_004690 [Pleurodeles waltl]